MIEYPLLNPWQHFTIYATHNVGVPRFTIISLTAHFVAIHRRGHE